MEKFSFERGAGILLHISSLPSPHGIGTLGDEAYSFAQFLRKAGQKYWQVLPLGPTGYGDSPYQAFSSYAGNPYFVDLDYIIQEGLLTRGEVERACRETGRFADYGNVYESRGYLLRLAYSRAKPDASAEFDEFCAKHSAWLDGYALFCAMKRKFGYRPYWEWDGLRAEDASRQIDGDNGLREEMEYIRYTQFLFFSQWERLRARVGELGIELIGDLPIYCARDSAEVWLSPGSFELDEKLCPSVVAGVPPDYFSENGQLWGNPLYDWDAIRKDGWRFWTERAAMTAALFDHIRLDHFRGFASYWRVPAGEPTAKRGSWAEGPGMELIYRIRQAAAGRGIIAEDLGLLDEPAKRLARESGFPGMRVLQFAFDSDAKNLHLPHNYERNCICYTGTHDNTTAAAFFEEQEPSGARRAADYLGLRAGDSAPRALLRCGQASVADVFIAQMQDYLGLGGECRMNAPGTASGNWRWRLLPGEASDELAEEILQMTQLFGRA